MSDEIKFNLEKTISYAFSNYDLRLEALTAETYLQHRLGIEFRALSSELEKVRAELADVKIYASRFGVSNEAYDEQSAKLTRYRDMCERLAGALVKVCKRNDIGEAVLDYYTDCSSALYAYEQFKKEVGDGRD